jgi:hypothetical protein
MYTEETLEFRRKGRDNYRVRISATIHRRFENQDMAKQGSDRGDGSKKSTVAGSTDVEEEV